MDDKQLEEMRRSMDLLNKKLDNQKIITERRTMETIKSKIGEINRRRRMFAGLAIAMCICGPISVCRIGAPLWFGIVTFLFFAISFIYQTLAQRKLKESDLSNEDLITVGNNIATMKKRNAQWLWFGIPFALIWVTTLLKFVISNSGNDKESALFFVTGITVGALIGIILGCRIYRRQQKEARSLITLIEEMRANR